LTEEIVIADDVPLTVPGGDTSDFINLFDQQESSSNGEDKNAVTADHH